MAKNRDKQYADIYRAFFENYKRTGDPEVRHMFAYTMGRFKERHIAGASKEALKIAEREGWDLREGKKWSDRRTAFLKCEHNLPKKQVLDELLGRLDTWDEKKALAITAASRCFWISKEEDDCLTEYGYANHRPETAYAECGIEIVPF
jgi:hypothetical protein